MEPPSISERHLLRHRLQTRKLLARNFTVHVLDGGFYAGGIAFLAEATILPVMVMSLGGPLWLLAAIPILMTIGFQIPPLLVAHRIERLHWVKPLVMVTGVLQRLPYLLAGLTLIFLAPSHPALALVAVALCPLMSGLACGVSLPAWLELVAKTVPGNRRSSLWAVRNIIGAAIGTLAGFVVTAVLARYPGTTGFGMLHLITLSSLTVSYVIFSFVRETDLPARPGRETPTLLTNLRSIPSLVAGNAQFRRYVASQAAASGLFIALPFLAIHSLASLGKGDSFAGQLLTAQMIGGAAGNLAAGYLGDRLGGRIVALLARMILCGLCLAMIFAASTWQFLGAFAVLGLAVQANGVGTYTLQLEICPLVKRATYLAILSATSVVTSLIASALGATAWRLTGGQFTAVAVLASAVLAVSVLCLLRLEEPRLAAVQ